ncbi:MAG TPA: thioredoxin domain-containing protein [Candidatus Angelobacter sp.]|jgi:protein-disulfide isomerase|nr:thioredoxin domain-containing protein [Candidatus Angelobacter sp.]
MTMLKVPVGPRDHVLGDEHAPVTLVEYGDYECPHCGRAHPIVKEVLRRFGSEVRFVFRHFPLTQIHPFAESAAETAEFAGAHQLFWKMHDGLFENQFRLGLPLFFELTKLLGLSTSELQTALETGAYTPRVRSDFMGGIRSGVNGTPTFFINGHRHDGTYELADLVLSIDNALMSVSTSAGD